MALRLQGKNDETNKNTTKTEVKFWTNKLSLISVCVEVKITVVDSEHLRRGGGAAGKTQTIRVPLCYYCPQQ